MSELLQCEKCGVLYEEGTEHVCDRNIYKQKQIQDAKQALFLAEFYEADELAKVFREKIEELEKEESNEEA